MPQKEWNDTRTDYPRCQCIHQLFEAQAQRQPDAVAVVFENRQLTYRELNEKADVLARHLLQVGVGPEVRVGVCLSRSLEMVIALYAIHKAGGAYLPLDPGYPAGRLGFMLEDSQAPVVVTQQSLLGRLAGAAARLVCVDTLAEPRSTSAGDFPLQQSLTQPLPTAENLAYLIYTSGSTGQPKGVMVRHRNVVNFFTGMDRAIGTEPGVWLAVTSISFDISVLELFWTLTRGFKVILLGDEHSPARDASGRAHPAPSDRADHSLAALILRHGVTHLQCTPTLAGMLIQDPKTLASLRQVKRLLFGGEPLPPALVSRLAGAGEIFNLYGPTETTVWSTFHPVTRNGNTIAIGRPLANTTAHVLDEQLRPVPVGTTGELFIGGEGVARGYLNRPELTSERFIADPFSDDPEARLYRTGDLARHRADGTLESLGRADQQVKMRGFRVELGEIEAVMRQHPAVQESAVTVWEPRPADKRLLGYYVAQNPPGATPMELRRFLREKLPEHMVPSMFISLQAMPLTPNGKLARNALPPPNPAHEPATLT